MQTSSNNRPFQQIMGKGINQMINTFFGVMSDSAYLHHQKRSIHHYYLQACSGGCSFIIHFYGMIRNRFIKGLSHHLHIILYLGLYCWLGIGHTYQNSGSFGFFLAGTGLLILSMLPVLFFVWKREKWKTDWTRVKYNTAWWTCFGAYISLLLLWTTPIGYTDKPLLSLIFIGGFSSWLLELTLLANSWYRKQAGHRHWFSYFSLESALFISITIISLALSVMGVSSIGDPQYNSGPFMLIGFEFRPGNIIMHFGTFLSFFLQFLFMYLCGYGYFIMNSKVLVPWVLKPHGALMYMLAGLALVGYTYPFIGYLFNHLPITARIGRIFAKDPFDLQNGFVAIFILLLSLPVILAVQWNKQNSQIMALEKEKVGTELDLLKQQLNPHFFFNTLNNLYALSLTQSKQTPESILQLSELMRYVIYKAKADAVDIRDEVKYLNDYMQLQQIRLKRDPDISFRQEIDIDTPPVAPLLLIVLVENAFKHGIETAEGKAFIQMELVTTRERLCFSCTNSFESGTGTAGIGLDNLQRRLQLLYPSKHKLKTEKENHIFKAELELDLS